VRKGKPFSRCKRCWRYQVTHPIKNPLHIERVPVKLYAHTVEELRRRIGQTEAARRMGTHPEHLGARRIAEKTTVTRRKYELAVKVLDDARAAGEDGFDMLAVKMANLIHQQRPGVPLDQRRRDYWGPKFEAECERRRHVLVTGALGWPMYVRERFTMEECDEWYRRGFSVPLDLVPREYWWDDLSGLPRFGEEMLGKDF
jgi:hypothetical protein